MQQNKPDTVSYKKTFFVLLALLSVVRLILAFTLELGNDESYYWLYSQYWQWNYFDHPPMVAFWIRLFTANLALEGIEGFVRLGSVTGCALASWFMFRTGTLLHSERAGLFTAVLYNASFYAGITAGLYMMPDSPQMVFWTGALLLIVKLTRNHESWKGWLLFGVVAGLCIMSKVHGAFLWIGMGAYLLFLRKDFLSKPQPYIAFLITTLLMSPIFFWNVLYDFATFRFHSNRVDVNEFIFHWRFFFKEVGTQIGFNNPVNFLLVVGALIAWFRKQIPWQPALAIYNFIAVPLSFLLLFVSLFSNVTLPHWSGPAYVALLPLAAIWLCSISARSFPQILRWGLGIFLVGYIAYAWIIQFYPGTYGAQDQENFGQGDITLDMYGWRKASGQFDSLYHSDVRNGIMPYNAAVVASHWWGAHVEYYFARPLRLKLIGLGKPQHLNQYLWTNGRRKEKVNLQYAYCIIPVDDKNQVPSEFFDFKELALIISVNRSGKPAHRFLVYRLKGLKKQLPFV